MFRLFPSGTNRYPRRAEVLNSYGRRANDNLLLEYGFAMLDNEWDEAEVVCSLPPRDQEQSLLDRRRKAFLRSSGQRMVRCAPKWMILCVIMLLLSLLLLLLLLLL